MKILRALHVDILRETEKHLDPFSAHFSYHRVYYYIRCSSSY
jgi:hypothetical protein